MEPLISESATEPTTVDQAEKPPVDPNQQPGSLDLVELQGHDSPDGGDGTIELHDSGDEDVEKQVMDYEEARLQTIR